MKKGIFTFGLVLTGVCATAQAKSPPPSPASKQAPGLAVDKMFNEDIHDPVP